MQLTELLTQLEQQKDEKKFLNTLFDTIPDLVWLKNKDGVYLKCNPRFEQFYGATESEIVGKTDYDFVNESLANSFREQDLIAIAADKPTTNEEFFSFADNSLHGTFETIKIPMKDENGKLTAILGIARDINDRKKREEELKIQANYDTLTGLTNRSVFMDKLTQQISLKEFDTHSNCVLFIDLDRFKDINETMGHSTGDKILIMVAQRLQKIKRKSDTLSRLGGDEFAILLVNVQTSLEASRSAQEVINTLKKPFIINKRKYHLTVSIGISISPDDSNKPERLLPLFISSP